MPATQPHPTRRPWPSPQLAPVPPDATTEQITADLRGNPRYQPFFAGQRPEWVKDFVNRTYALAENGSPFRASVIPKTTFCYRTVVPFGYAHDR